MSSEPVPTPDPLDSLPRQDHRSLRNRFEAARVQALADAGCDAEKATRLLVNRLLHEPITRLRKIAACGNDARELSRFDDMLKRLFDLDDEDSEQPS